MARLADDALRPTHRRNLGFSAEEVRSAFAEKGSLIAATKRCGGSDEASSPLTRGTTSFEATIGKASARPESAGEGSRWPGRGYWLGSL